MKQARHNQWQAWASVIVLLLLTGPVHAAQAEHCAQNNEIFTVKHGTSVCINPGSGHKVVHCVVTGLQQNAYLLVTQTGFTADSPYHIPKAAIHINHNQQRIVFGGVATPGSEVVFHYFGPWDPSYQFNLTCGW